MKSAQIAMVATAVNNPTKRIWLGDMPRALELEVRVELCSIMEQVYVGVRQNATRMVALLNRDHVAVSWSASGWTTHEDGIKCRAKRLFGLVMTLVETPVNYLAELVGDTVQGTFLEHREGRFRVGTEAQ